MMNYEIFKEVVKEKFMDYMPTKEWSLWQSQWKR